MKKISNGGLFLLLSLFLLSGKVEAETMSGETDDTPVTVRITEPAPLYLKNVVPPTFGRYPVQGSAFKIQAESDLIIDVVDQRTDNNQWKLNYSLSLFKNQGNHELAIDFKKGQLTASDDTVYQANAPVTFNTGATIELVRVTTGSPQTYQYVIPKGNITMTVPANSPVGTYQAIQTVTLIDAVTDVY